MGMWAHVQVLQPEYGDTKLSSIVQPEIADWLTAHGVDISGCGDDGPDYADHWDIDCYGSNKDKIRKLIAELRENPRIFDDEDDGAHHAMNLADLLEEGLDVAVKRNYDYIQIDWF